jgi:hypothetical protein
MQDADLLLELAAIAGVFVGFGALIAVRSGGASDPFELSPTRGVVLMGMMTIIAAVLPVTLGRYDLADHDVWLLSSVLSLAAFVGLGFVFARTPEYRAVAKDLASARFAVVERAAYVLYMIAVALLPICIVLGLAPELEPALYFTFVVVLLLGAAWTLLWLVLSQRRPAAT